MKTPLIKSTVFALSAMLLATGTARLYAGQPEMTGAIEQLEHARKSEHPLEHLEKAKHDLKEAAHNKHGERVEAIHQIEEAIKDEKKHEHHRMEEHIERAIKEIREGKRDARK